MKSVAQNKKERKVHVDFVSINSANECVRRIYGEIPFGTVDVEQNEIKFLEIVHLAVDSVELGAYNLLPVSGNTTESNW